MAEVKRWRWVVIGMLLTAVVSSAATLKATGYWTPAPDVIPRAEAEAIAEALRITLAEERDQRVLDKEFHDEQQALLGGDRDRWKDEAVRKTRLLERAQGRVERVEVPVEVVVPGPERLVTVTKDGPCDVTDFYFNGDCRGERFDVGGHAGIRLAWRGYASWVVNGIEHSAQSDWIPLEEIEFEMAKPPPLPDTGRWWWAGIDYSGRSNGIGPAADLSWQGRKWGGMIGASALVTKQSSLASDFESVVESTDVDLLVRGRIGRKF